MLSFLDLCRDAGLVVAGIALLAAAANDVRRYEVPDACSLAIIAGFAAASPALGLWPALFGLAAGFVAFLLGCLLFARRMMGGGDVKLLAAISLFLTPALVAPFLTVTSFAGALVGLALITPLRRLLPAAPAGLAPAEGGRLAQPMPYAVAIAAGGLLVIVSHLHG